MQGKWVEVVHPPWLRDMENVEPIKPTGYTSSFLKYLKKKLLTNVSSGGWEIGVVINLASRFLISPWYVEETPAGLSLCEASWIRKILCVVLHSIILACIGMVALLTLYSESKVVAPRFLFVMLMEAFNVTGVVLLMYKLWFRKRQLQTLFQEFGKITLKRSPHLRAELINRTAPIVFLAFAIVNVCYPNERHVGRIRTGLLLCTGNKTANHVPMYVWYETLVVDPSCTSILGKVHLFVYIIGQGLGLIMAGFVHRIVLGASTYGYRVAENLVRDEKGSIDHQQRLIDDYKRAKHVFGQMNKTTSFFSLILVVQIVLKMSSALSGFSDWHQFVRPLYIAYDCYAYASLLYAAEAHKLMREAKGYIISRTVENSANMETSLAQSPGHSGIMGWNFFTISYTFLGSTLTAAFTYGLVALQFASPSSN